MSYYHTRPYCGGTLGPGEKCDCEKEKARLHKASRTNNNLIIQQNLKNVKGEKDNVYMHKM